MSSSWCAATASSTTWKTMTFIASWSKRAIRKRRARSWSPWRTEAAGRTTSPSSSLAFPPTLHELSAMFDTRNGNGAEFVSGDDRAYDLLKRKTSSDWTTTATGYRMLGRLTMKKREQAEMTYS